MIVKAGEQKASVFNCSLIIGLLFFFLLLNTPIKAIISDCLQVPAFQVCQRYLQIKKVFFVGGGLIMKKLALEIHVSVLG
jgi:hypothetical protein